MYQIDYNYYDSVIRLKLSGELSLDIIQKMAAELYVNQTDDKVLLLTDAREVKYDFGISDIESLVQLTNSFVKTDTLLIEAILIDSPEKTAITTIYDHEKKRNNHLHRIFYTEKEAINWLISYK